MEEMRIEDINVDAMCVEEKGKGGNCCKSGIDSSLLFFFLLLVVIFMGEY